MSASDHLQGEQLRMFMPAKELISIQPNRADYSQHVYNRDEEGLTANRGSFWQSKLDEASGESETWTDHGDILDSVTETGVKNPVHLHHASEHPEGTMIANGHHRIASANYADPNSLVPVLHWGPESQFHSAVQGAGRKYFP